MLPRFREREGDDLRRVRGYADREAHPEVFFRSDLKDECLGQSYERGRDAQVLGEPSGGQSRGDLYFVEGARAMIAGDLRYKLAMIEAAIAELLRERGYAEADEESSL